MMNFNGYSIEKYHNCEIFHNVCDIQPKGFSREISRKDILNIAISNRCPIVVKDDEGKWYLKGTDRQEDFLRNKILKSNPEKWKRYVLYFIPELCEQPSSKEKEITAAATTTEDTIISRTFLIERRHEHWELKTVQKKNEAVKKRLFEAILYGRRS